ncbi:FeS assembly protein SufD, partial [mine drainage metagenome]
VIGGERRREAIEALCAQGLPSTREENWRYANLRVLERARFSPCASPAGIADLPAPLAGFSRLVFIDGMLAMGEPVQHAGLAVHSLRSGAQGADASGPQCIAALPETRLALLNEAFATDGAAIRVRREAGTAQIELLFIAHAPALAGASYPRVRLSIETGARLTLVERHLSAGEWGEPGQQRAARGSRRRGHASTITACSKRARAPHGLTRWKRRSRRTRATA